MKIGLCLPQLNQHADRTAVSGFARNAEAAGFDSLWVQDHFMVPENPQVGYAGGPPELKMPDPYRCMLSPLETLAFVAAITERAQIGTSILVTAYYRPLMLAKRLASIDVLSGGRLVAGLGLGWSKDEYDQMDTPFARRGARMTDFIRALKAEKTRGRKLVDDAWRANNAHDMVKREHALYRLLGRRPAAAPAPGDEGA